MKLTEKMSYLQGLLDGLEIDNSTKEGKALVQMADVMSELVAYVEDLQSQVDELTELCDILDQDLGQVEDDIYDEDDEDYDFDDLDDCDDCFDEDDEDFDFDDDELYEITCPSCGDTILIDEGMIEEGSINCPNCDELLEFDVDDLTIEDFEKVEETVEEEKKD
ncbi:MAG: hypothetical protein IKV85_09160 [Ruminococcus sp.]|nr:hypothetical protein [Ruminococcus sp.]